MQTSTAAASPAQTSNTASRSALTEAAEKIARSLYPDTNGELTRSIFEPLLGSEGEKMKEDRIHILSGLVKSTEIPTKAIVEGINRSNPDIAKALGKAFVSVASKISVDDNFVFIDGIKEKHPDLVVDLVEENLSLNKLNLRKVLRENVTNRNLWLKFGQMDLEKRK